jgi:hypothetical protein
MLQTAHPPVSALRSLVLLSSHLLAGLALLAVGCSSDEDGR